MAARVDQRLVLAAGLAGAAVSGAPSTVVALATGRSPLEGARAAGSILLPAERRTAPLLAAATVAHLSLSLGWAAVLARALPAGRRLRWAPAAGVAIAALDLGVIGRRIPAIRALAPAPQVADHVAYALAVAAVLDRPGAPAGA
jgi:hypothetical protein